jgi:hypothetical protein
MIILENIETGNYHEGNVLEFFVNEETLIGEVYLDGFLIFQDIDIIDEEQLELSFNKNFIQTDVDDYQYDF